MKVGNITPGYCTLPQTVYTLRMNTKPVCSIEGCGNPKFSYGYCTVHANNFVRRKDPLKFPARRAALHTHCTHEDCKEVHYGKGLCRAHYRRKHEKGIAMEKTPCVVCASPDVRRVGSRFCSDTCSAKWHRAFGAKSKAAKGLRLAKCIAEGCEEPHHAKGYCDAHYKRVVAHGDPAVNASLPAMDYCTRCKRPRGKVDVKRQGSRELCGTCYGQDYYFLNHVKERARRNSRRSYLRRQTPPWADLDAITAFYAACPEGQNVDHILPLRGRKVSGLHVETNLQYLPAGQNKRKANKFDTGG